MPPVDPDENNKVIDLSLDSAIELHDELGIIEKVKDNPSADSVEVALDADSAAKVKKALRDGMIKANVIAFTDDGPDDDD